MDKKTLGTGRQRTYIDVDQVRATSGKRGPLKGFGGRARQVPKGWSVPAPATARTCLAAAYWALTDPTITPTAKAEITRLLGAALGPCEPTAPDVARFGFAHAWEMLGLDPDDLA